MTILPLILLALSPIQIDGSFDDWAEGVTRQEDTQYTYAIIELPNEQCLQQLPQQKVVEIGEYTVFFSPNNKGYGVSCKKGEKWISPYEAGIIFAPTTASTKFELRVNKPNVKMPQTPFSFKRKGDVRVVSWNVQFGNLLDDKDRGARILKALDPDVLLLQELDGVDTSETLCVFLDETLEKKWSAGLSKVHGTERHHQLRSAVATSFASKRNVSIDEQKAIYSVIDIQDKPVNFVSLHLRCCGGPTGEAEERRQEESTAIHHLVDNTSSPRWIIAGDWNLVGTTKPLNIVRAGQFAIVEAYQPDGLLNATWSDTTSSFTPGRLDWMLYSPETLKPVNSFVLDTSDLDTTTLNNSNLNAEDTAKLSDHLPLVADFELIK
jgi:endonuclease/exonuclease/phosphatase family metal-dependent hydrolase